MATELTELGKAAAAVAKARARLEAAIYAAADAGHSTRAIGEAVGMSHEGVRKILQARTPSDAELAAKRRRLELIDATWERFVDGIVPMFELPEEERKREQAYRNVENGRARRQAAGVTRTGKKSGASAWKSTTRGTVTEQVRAAATKYALRLLEDRVSDPVVAKIVALLDEAETLRESLQALGDSRVPFLHD